MDVPRSPDPYNAPTLTPPPSSAQAGAAVGRHCLLQRLRRAGIIGILATGLVFVALAQTQDKPDDDAVWKAFIGWFKSVPKDADPFKAYAAKLEQEGVPKPEVQRRVTTIVRLFQERPEGIEISFDWIFAQPRTGDPAEDRMSTTPTAFLVDAVKAMKPGAALDLGTGMGRNAVYLARQGWDVTGMDISQVALDAARASAAKAGVSIRTEKAAYDTFDFGINKWDLIVMVFAWAPVEDPAFVAKLRGSLRPGGLVLFEHFCEPMAPMIHALKRNDWDPTSSACLPERDPDGTATTTAGCVAPHEDRKPASSVRRNSWRPHRLIGSPPTTTHSPSRFTSICGSARGTSSSPHSACAGHWAWRWLEPEVTPQPR